MAPILSTTRFPGRYATSSSQLHPRDARTAVRQLGLSTFAAFAKVTGRTRTALSRPRVQIFRFHHVLDDEQVPFRSMLRALSRHHTFIGYAEAVRRIESGDIDEPYAALTFDHGQRNGKRAAKIMQEFGITACFFVCPAIIGETDYQKIRQFCIAQLDLPPVPFMSYPDLEALLELGHEVGSHGMHHVDLAAVDPEEAAAQIDVSRRVLQKHLGKINHFAWPYGQFENLTPEAASAVFQSGYTSCASTERGGHGPASHVETGPPCIRREPIQASWPAEHALYLASLNSQRLEPDGSAWPEGWNVEGRKTKKQAKGPRVPKEQPQQEEPE
jgi:peptidoglycan/xylan/chitin deacetylase (PgdA/CDA1 family)